MTDRFKAKRIDDKGRCCGRKPIAYKRPPRLFCPRCDAEFDVETGWQVSNFHYVVENGVIVDARFVLDMEVNGFEPFAPSDTGGMG